MSSEFWLGTAITALLFVIGSVISVISVFAEDIRQSYKAWRHSRRLRGTDLRIHQLQRRISEIEFYRTNPEALSAMLWHGFYLLLQLTIVIIFFVYMTWESDVALIRSAGKLAGLLFGFALWIFLQAIVRKTERLSRPDIEAPKLAAELAKLQLTRTNPP